MGFLVSKITDCAINSWNQMSPSDKWFFQIPSSCPVSLFGLYETYDHETLKFVIIKPILS